MKKKYLVIASIAAFVALSPVIAAAVTATTTITATVTAVISLSTSSTVAFSLTPTAGGVVSSNSDTVTVSTNDTLGYTLTLADTDATTTLVSGANTFTAHTGTWGAGSTLTNGKWGFCIAAATGCTASYSAETNNGSSTTLWAGMPATGSPATLKTTATTASGDVTTVWYAAKANSSQPTGAYTDSVTYTATAN